MASSSSPAPKPRVKEHYSTRLKHQIKELQNEVSFLRAELARAESLAGNKTVDKPFVKPLEKKSKPNDGDGGDDGGDDGNDDPSSGDDDNKGNLAVMFQNEEGEMKQEDFTVFFDDDSWDIVKNMLRGRINLNRDIIITLFEEPNGEVLEDDGGLPLFEFAPGGDTIFAEFHQGTVFHPETFKNITIRLNENATEVITMTPDDTITELKQVLSGRVTVPVRWCHIKLRQRDMILEDEMQIRDLGEDILHFGIYGLAGGKRARGNASGGGNKDDRIKAVKDVIQMAQLRFNASQCSPTITEMAGLYEQLVTKATNSPNSVFSELLKNIPRDDLPRLIAVISSTNNSTSRFKEFASVIYKNKKEGIAELKAQLEMVEKTNVSSMEYLLMCEFGDEAGNIGWTALSKVLTDLIGQTSS